MFKAKINWIEELPAIKQLGLLGYTLEGLAGKYGVTRQRMKQVVDKHIPDWKDHYGKAVHRKKKEEESFKKWGIKMDTELYAAQRQKFQRKKQNAQRTGWTWDISFGEIDWPTHCPILGIELDYFLDTRAENSPSFDQIKPGKGYVSGNVQVISWRANRIKNDGTAEEHRKIAEFLDTLNNDTLESQE